MSQEGAAGLIAIGLVLIGGVARLRLRAGGRADLKGLATGLVLAGLMFGLLALVFVWAKNMD
jgi:hypothetical protein